MSVVISRITKYGMEFGPVKVHRSWSDKDGSVGLMIYTGKQIVNIRVTPSGLIRLGNVEKDWHRGEQP